MRALVCELSLPRLALTRALSLLRPRAYVGPTAPIGLREIPDPVLPAPDWVTIRARLAGLCGSDYKQVFLKGGTDNPITALISFPQVLGHEVVGTLAHVGPESGRRPGERVVLNPWLSCGPAHGLPCAPGSAWPSSASGSRSDGMSEGELTRCPGRLPTAFPRNRRR